MYTYNSESPYQVHLILYSDVSAQCYNTPIKVNRIWLSRALIASVPIFVGPGVFIYAMKLNSVYILHWALEYSLKSVHRWAEYALYFFYFDKNEWAIPGSK